MTDTAIPTLDNTQDTLADVFKGSTGPFRLVSPQVLIGETDEGEELWMPGLPQIVDSQGEIICVFPGPNSLRASENARRVFEVLNIAIP